MDRERASQVVRETFMRAAHRPDKFPDESEDVLRWLLKIAAHVLQTQSNGRPELSWDTLDQTLRSESTRTDLVQSLTDPQRNYLLWELKQGCMTAVINCLPLGERLAFVLHILCNQNEQQAAATLGISDSAFKVRLSRARKKVADYLAPRCEHINPLNPCRCPSRIGVALHQGFLGPPPNARVRIRPPFGRYGSQIDGEDAPLRDVTAVYKSLPDCEAPTELGEDMLRELDEGAWKAASEQTL